MEDTIMVVITLNEDGWKFVDQLMYRKKSFAVLTNNRAEEQQYQKTGVKHGCKSRRIHQEWKRRIFTLKIRINQKLS